jgi:hypothetical protein
VRRIIFINSVVIVLLALFFFIYPPIRAGLDLRDPALRGPGAPKMAWRLYRNLTPRYATWAKQRIAEGRAENLSTKNISGTEWPLFGSVFYLWGVENLQGVWEGGDHSAGLEPKVFGHDAIVAAADLVIDPRHAAWVKKHWGDDYLHRENVFYRMLVIAALTTREKLLHDGAHLDMLRDQVETLATELDASKTGLLNDYPGECYPGDVMASLMCIKRADAILGTDHSKIINRALRAFTGTKATRHQLPPYSANAGTGAPTSEARGCASSYMCLTSPELWPGQAKQWFEFYDRYFWQERLTAAGYREHPKEVPHSNWTIDVDAGPVVAGYGVAASAFGVGAARKNGRFDRALPLAAEMLATAGELPNGVLTIPRLLSNLSEAPLLGEAAILWQLSIQPEKGFPIKGGGHVPKYVYIVLITVFLFGVWRILEAIWAIREARRPPGPEVGAPLWQGLLWTTLLLGAVSAFCMGHSIPGLLVLVLAVMLPLVKRKRPPKGTEDWPDAKQPVKDQPPQPGGT